jgi:hypothetical protein
MATIRKIACLVAALAIVLSANQAFAGGNDAKKLYNMISKAVSGKKGGNDTTVKRSGGGVPRNNQAIEDLQKAVDDLKKQNEELQKWKEAKEAESQAKRVDTSNFASYYSKEATTDRVVFGIVAGILVILLVVVFIRAKNSEDAAAALGARQQRELQQLRDQLPQLVSAEIARLMQQAAQEEAEAEPQQPGQAA